MIDKLDLRVPRRAPFTASFTRLYAELRAMERGPFHAAKHYEFVGDLREYGFRMRLHLYCRMDKARNHKVELIDAGELTRGEMLREVREVFDVTPSAMGVMRIDFAVDVPEVPVAWFRQTTRVEHKRFRAGLTDAPFYGEMGCGGIQTLYFGKRPNVIRIYDKQAERKQAYRTMIRRMGKGADVPSFESIYGCSMDESILTRVERQIGGRVPIELDSFDKVIESGTEYKPFSKLKILSQGGAIDWDSNLSFETNCTARYLSELGRRDGMQAVDTFVSGYSKGNAGWARRKYEPLMASAANAKGITAAKLQERFVSSLRRQLSA
jgi:hypothetical protein